MNTKLVALAALLIAFAVPGIASAALHSGDTVKIAVYNHPELSTQAVVDAEGRVSMPLAGAVPAVGSTEGELAARIQSRLANYMRFPAVDVTLIAQDAQMFVVGGPGGTVQYRAGDTLSTAFADIESACKCSLSTSAGDTSRVRIIRDGTALGPFDADAMKAQGDPGPSLLPGDRIAFANRPLAITVKGAIKEPGTAYLSQGQPLSTALDQLGGLTASASYGQILLQRNGDLVDIGQGSPEFSAPAQAGDAIMIPSQEHIQVLGAVNAGGDVVLKQDFTLLSAVYIAGGPNRWADSAQHHGTSSRRNANIQHDADGAREFKSQSCTRGWRCGLRSRRSQD